MKPSLRFSSILRLGGKKLGLHGVMESRREYFKKVAVVNCGDAVVKGQQEFFRGFTVAL